MPFPRRPASRSAPAWVSLIVAAALLIATSAQANDSAIDWSAGQLKFTRTEGVVMEQEVLTITSDRVTVEYQFRNVKGQDVETEVGFPRTIQFGQQRAEEEGMDVPPDDWQPFTFRHVDFKLFVDGKPHGFATKWRGSKSETEFLYQWTQRFPAGAAVRIAHEFVTSPDGMSLGPSNKDDWERLAQKYCVGPRLAATMTNPKVTRLNYILKTGANWGGPIQHFRLVLKKQDRQQRISLCLKGLVKTSATTFVVEKRDFVPEEDLNIVFLDP